MKYHTVHLYVMCVCHIHACRQSAYAHTHTHTHTHTQGTAARAEMMKSKLPNSVLRRIWALSDIDQDGQLDRDEFAVAMFLIDHKLEGNDLPDILPERVIPPAKRALVKRRTAAARGGGGGPGERSAGYSSRPCECVFVYFIVACHLLRCTLGIVWMCVCVVDNRLASTVTCL